MSHHRHAKGKANRQAINHKPKAATTSPTAPAETSQPEQTSNPAQGVFGSFMRTVKNHPIYTALTVCAGLLAFWQHIETAFNTEFAEPEIHVTYSDPASPFVFPFSLKNNGKVSMDGIEWDCIVQHMEALPSGQLTLDRVGFRTHGAQVPPLAESDTVNHICNVISQRVPIRFRCWKRMAS